MRLEGECTEERAPLREDRASFIGGRALCMFLALEIGVKGECCGRED